MQKTCLNLVMYRPWKLNQITNWEEKNTSVIRIGQLYKIWLTIQLKIAGKTMPNYTQFYLDVRQLKTHSNTSRLLLRGLHFYTE